MTVSDTLANTTRAAHDVGLAAWLGGAMFGKLARNPSLEKIASHSERGSVDGAVPVLTGTKPAAETPAKAAKIQRSLGLLGTLNIAAGVALVAVNGILAQTNHSHPAKKRALLRSHSGR